MKHPEKYEIKKKDEGERLRLYRQRRKLGLVKSRNAGDKQRQENEQQPAESTPKSFSTKDKPSIRQAEKALPVRPRKKTEVIRGLVKRYRSQVKLAETRGRKQIVSSEEEKEWLLTLFDRLDIMYINPGRKENVYICKETGIFFFIHFILIWLYSSSNAYKYIRLIYAK